VWAIAESASGVHVAQSQQDLTTRSPEVLALGFASREVPRTEVRVGTWQRIRWDPRGQRVDTHFLEIGVNTPLNSRISGIRGIGE
jgi:hypothetical protein